MLSCSVVSDSATPWTVDHQASLSMGFPRQGRWSGLPCSPPGDLANPGIEPVSLMSPALQVDYLLLIHQGRPHSVIYSYKKSHSGIMETYFTICNIHSQWEFAI